MSFFASCSNIAITGGHFINVRTHEPTEDVLPRLLSKRKEPDSSDSEFDVHSRRKRHRSRRNSDGLMVVKRDELDLRTEIINSGNYRIYSASHEGRVVAVKVFEGLHAKKDWIANVLFAKKFFHSNVPKMVGISDEGLTPFLILHGISEKRMQSLIARALRTDLDKSVHLSMKAVKGLAAGLSYMESQNISLNSRITSNDRKWENFDIFAGENDEAIISMHQSSAVSEAGSASQVFDIESNGHGLEALTGLCQKLFSEVNSILYDDSPERESDAATLLSATQNDSTSSYITESGAISPLKSKRKSRQKSKPSRIPRREVRWRLDSMDGRNRSLYSIARRFEDYLDCFQSPLRRILGSNNADSKRISHQCPEYLREEINLTCDVKRSAIISYEFPDQGELCSVCGQLVQYQHSETSMMGVAPTVGGGAGWGGPRPDLNMFSSEFMNNMTTSLEGSPGTADLFGRPDDDINFEWDFAQWSKSNADDTARTADALALMRAETLRGLAVMQEAAVDNETLRGNYDQAIALREFYDRVRDEVG